MAEFTSRQLACAWLKGEDAWQWKRGNDGKFPIQANIASLEESQPENGTWSVVFMGYGTELVLNRNGVNPTKVVQAAGKMAATARALAVTVRTYRFGEPYLQHFNGVNYDSLRTLDDESHEEDGPSFHDYKHENLADTRFVVEFYGLLREVGNDITISPTALSMGRHLTRYSIDFLSGFIADAVTNNAPLPQPGISRSEPVQPWDLSTLVYRGTTV